MRTEPATTSSITTDSCGDAFAGALRQLRGFLKLFEKIYEPLTAGLLAPFRADRILAEDKRCQLDRLYQNVCDDLDARRRAVGIKTAA